MKTEVKKLDGNKREISIEVSGDIVKNKFEEVFQRLGKEAKVKGFRPGHVPRDIIEKQFSALAHEQVLKELMSSVYGDAVEKEKLEVIELPEVSDVKLDKSTLSFKATVEITPEVNLKDYKGLKVSFEDLTVAPDEIKRNLDSLKETKKAQSIDDVFAKGLGYSSLAEFEKLIQAQLLIQKSNAQRQKNENQLIEQLNKDLDFKLPQSMVARQKEELLRQAKLDLALKGIPKEHIASEESKISESLDPEAKKQVKNWLVLSAVARKENITIDDQMPGKVIELLFKEANWQKK